MNDDLELAYYCRDYDGPGETVAEFDYLFDKYPLGTIQSVIDCLEDGRYLDDDDLWNYCYAHSFRSYDEAVERYEDCKIGDEDQLFELLYDTANLRELAELYKDNLIELLLRDQVLNGEFELIDGIYYSTR